MFLEGKDHCFMDMPQATDGVPGTQEGAVIYAISLSKLSSSN